MQKDHLLTEFGNTAGLPIEFEEKYYTKFKQKIFTSLQKFGSSRKTKSVHKLVEKNLVYLTIVSGEDAHRLGHCIFSETRLKAILMNVFMYNDSLDNHGSVKLAGEITRLRGLIQKEKAYIDDKQIYNIEQLNIQLDGVMEKLINSIDYLKLVDGIYFEYLRYLSRTVLLFDLKAKPKVLGVCTDIISASIRSIYQKINREVDQDASRIIDAVAAYFVLVYYFGNDARLALKRLEEGYGEDSVQKIKNTRITKFEGWGDLAFLLKELELLNATPAALEIAIEKMFGKYGYTNYINQSLQDMMAFMANLAYNTQLFNAFPIKGDLHLRLEELILNSKKLVQIIPRTGPFQ